MANDVRAVHRIVTTGAVSLLLLTHHGYRLLELYLLPRGVSLALVLLGFAVVVGSVAVRRSRVQAEWALLSAAAAAGVASVVPFLVFDRGALGLALSVGCGVLVAASAALAASSLAREMGRAVLALGFVEQTLEPLWLLGWGAFLGAMLLVESHVGFVRAGLLVGAFLALAASALPRARAFVKELRPAPSRARLVACAVVAAAGAAGLTLNLRLPTSELASFPDEVVFATSVGMHRYVVAAAPGGYELFRDGQLAIASLDRQAAAEALIGAALRASRGGRVLLVGSGGGGVEGRILRDPRVTELTVVAEDDGTERLARALWGGEIESRKLRRVRDEPLAWLGGDRGPFDLVVLNLPAPLGYREGKLYTHHFFARAAAGLAPDGVLVTRATSAFEASAAFSNVVATVRSVGLETISYHVPLETLGVASFVMGSVRDGKVRLAESSTLDVGRDLESGAVGAVATLDDQRVLAAFAARSRGRSE